MKLISLTTGLALAALSTPGLAAPATPPSAAQPAVTPAAAVSRSVELPDKAGPGTPKEVRVLADEPDLKLVTIVLRAGTALPTHQTKVSVTIVALQGTGTVVTGTARLPLDATHAVVLPPGVPHAVEPATGTDLVLLVHHVGQR